MKVIVVYKKSAHELYKESSDEDLCNFLAEQNAANIYKQ